ncbi:MAG: 4-hydroxythreonine-4-phosphate dehydrogenase PdxA [Proteobacteria bacterium]|nr:4-hydroxythreonine-4-phosphate dehydrogenase PdxA [Pseudomonadota bacterium]MBI3495793.1 4-hydroxythreonine-4-phosphate dehydrogenase PdxA [Pseudomonadota bacterium]
MALPLAVTMGEPAGIGGEITLKAWLRRTPDLPVFFVLDDPARLADLARRTGMAASVEAIEAPERAHAVFARALPVLPLALARPSVPGRPDPQNAAAVLASIARAVDLVTAGVAAAMVTNPINKQVLYQSGFRHPGHTEYLAELAAPGGTPPTPVMMLASPELRVVPVSIHVSLRQAIQSLTTRKIVEIGRIAAEGLRLSFGIEAPRLGVAGLNPHAGEGGALGREDIDIVAPAVAELQRHGIDAMGPLPPDAMFHAEARRHYDAALCMYHDQALIPLKTLDFFGGVNVTLGLPFVRTSPDHGTAFDIAGTGTANAESLLAAIRLAASMAENRRRGQASVEHRPRVAIRG